MFVIKGVLVDREIVRGSKDGRSWSYEQLHLLSGRRVYRARVADDCPPYTLPDRYGVLLAKVSLRPWQNEIFLTVERVFSDDEIEEALVC